MAEIQHGQLSCLYVDLLSGTDCSTVILTNRERLALGRWLISLDFHELARLLLETNQTIIIPPDDT